MKTSGRHDSHRFISVAVSVFCTLAIFYSSRPVQAADSLAYSYETDQLGGPDGVTANGGGTYTQDTIGATNGPHSMKVSLITGGDTFVGAITPLINPTPGGAIIGDPPGIDHILFDVTITEQYTGTFANMGVTVFGCDQASVCGLKRQFTDEENVALTLGTHTDLRIDLTSSFETGESFNETFGEAGSGSDLIPTHFQLYFNKNFNAPLTLFIDNVRVGMTSAGVPGDYNGNGVVDGADYVVWRNNGPLLNEVADPGTISAADYTEWRARFGNTSGSGLASAAVPEPSDALLWLVASACCSVRRLRKKAC